MVWHMSVHSLAGGHMIRECCSGCYILSDGLCNCVFITIDLEDAELTWHLSNNLARY